jgi:uracil-DNA glycosylase
VINKKKNVEIMEKIEFLNEPCDWKSLSLYDFMYTERNYPRSWKDFFLREDVKKEIKKVSDHISSLPEKIIVYPEIHNVFRAFYCTSLKNIRAVIIGQDPYHGGNATGLCFDVRKGGALNPSLRNIYKELENEGYRVSRDGNLKYWTKSIFLINTALTVEKGDADSHTHVWYDFSEKVVEYIAKRSTNVVWLLWGSKAQAYSYLLDGNNHKIIKTSHPSPFSANRGYRDIPAFMGSGCFREANEFLESKMLSRIEWET